MDEYVRRQYLKEEDFLEDWYETVDLVVPRLNHPWQPNYRCSDRTRQQQAMLLASGRRFTLTFDSAVIFYSRDGFSSLRLNLRSSERLFVVRIRWLGAEVVTETLADVPTELRR